MRRSSIVAWVVILLALLGSGCAQGAGNNSPPIHKEPTAPVEDTEERTTPSDHQSLSGSDHLECLGNESVSTAGGAIPEGVKVKGTKVPPLQQTRRGFSEKIREGDRVVGGHGRGTVLVIREGRTVAITHDLRDGSGGWLENGYNACPGF
jgi:hypothetical protein